MKLTARAQYTSSVYINDDWVASRPCLQSYIVCYYEDAGSSDIFGMCRYGRLKPFQKSRCIRPTLRSRQLAFGQRDEKRGSQDARLVKALRRGRARCRRDKRCISGVLPRRGPYVKCAPLGSVWRCAFRTVQKCSPDIPLWDVVYVPFGSLYCSGTGGTADVVGYIIGELS